jgi:hypothetical protein
MILGAIAGFVVSGVIFSVGLGVLAGVVVWLLAWVIGVFVFVGEPSSSSHRSSSSGFDWDLF